MARTQKLFSKIEPNNCMTTTVRINYKDLLFLCSTSLDCERRGKEASWTYGLCSKRRRYWERRREWG
jgi:hypothetical protein